MRVMNDYDVLVIGGGPAGLSAGLVLGRARRRTAIVDGRLPRNRFAAHMHGVLGHDGRSPSDFARLGREEVSRYGVVVIDATAVRIWRRDAATFAVATDSGATLFGRRLLVASSLRDELPAIAGLAEQWGTGVATCPYCDGWEVRDGRIGVLGTGPFGVHQAHVLRQWSSRVTYVPCKAGVPSEDDRRALAARGIEVERNAIVRVLATASGRLRGVALDDGRELAFDKIFLMPRPVPCDDALRDLGAATSEGPLGSFVTVDAAGKTSVEGVWAAGNVTGPVVNVPAAIGAGALAAAAINWDLVTDEIAVAVASAR